MIEVERRDGASYAALFVLQAVMLGALFTETPPHPPQATPLFGMGPFLGAALALVAAAALLGATRTRAGAICTIAVVITALVSFGPQKWFDPAIDMIWPAVALAQLCVLSLLWSLGRKLFNTKSEQFDDRANRRAQQS